MVHQYFAHYLLNQGKLTPSQMYEALEQERSVRVKLGTLAIHAGLMNAAAVEEVHHRQRSQDRQFGALAVEMGYLTEPQLTELLNSQGKENLTFIQTVTDKGFLSLAELETTLAEYLQKIGLSKEEWARLDANNDAQLVRSLVDFSAEKDRSEVLYSYVGLLLRNIVRFLNDKPMLALPARLYEQREDWLAIQSLAGAVNMSAGLAMQEKALLAAASRFCGEPFERVNALALDSVGEFLNVHHGVFCANLANTGLEVDLMPQSVQKSPGLRQYAYRIPLATSFGQMDLVLALPD